ncbi:MAG: AMP-binding protein, partial [Ignavibacteriaceae bacterium]
MNVFDYLFFYSKDLKKDFVLGPSEQISYQQLYEKGLKLARYLEKEIGENNNIILISQNSVFFLIAYLGIMNSGNVCVPLNPVIEQENLDFIIKATESKTFFVPQRTREKYSLPDTKIINETDLDTLINSVTLPDNSLPEKFDENRLAQILFTSGSTGLPKGVMLSHKNLIANTDSIVEYLKLTSDDIIEIVLPFYYCYGLSLLHTHLKVGGSVVLNNNFVFFGAVLSDLDKYKCTGFAGVPSHFQILLRKSKSFKKSELPSLRYFTQAGGKLHNVFIQELIEAFPQKKFYVMYGQTEATARLSYLPPELLQTKLGSIGKGIPNVTLEVFYKNDQPVKDGEVGEIVAKGDNIMLGYLNDPEGNKLTLRNGWLHTGDIAKKDEDGYIYLVAREKEIIKVGGKRISPKEIEEVIVSVPEVVDCTIEGVYDEILSEAIKATVVLIDNTDEVKAKETILSTCRNKLVLYKIPQIIEFRKKLEVNQAGKKVSSIPLS